MPAKCSDLRRDVRIVNLSLLNAPWYIKQLRDEDVTVPIALNDKFIDERLCGDTLLVGRTRQWTTEPKEVTVAGMTWNMPPSVIGSISGKRVGLLSVSSYMVAHIIKENNWEAAGLFWSYRGPGSYDRSFRAYVHGGYADINW